MVAGIKLARVDRWKLECKEYEMLSAGNNGVGAEGEWGRGDYGYDGTNWVRREAEEKQLQ